MPRQSEFGERPCPRAQRAQGEEAVQAHIVPTTPMHNGHKETTTQMQKVAKTTKAEFDYGRTWRLV